MNIYKKLGKTKVIAICILIAVLLVGVIILLTYNKEGVSTVISKTSLQKVIEVSELNTIEYPYNSIATTYDENGKDILYHVYYEGTVKAGLDFDKIKYTVDKENKKVTLELPKIKINKVKVDINSLDYIYIEGKEKENKTQEVLEFCEADLQKKAQEEQILKLAKENAVSKINFLISPWIKSIDAEYTVEIK